MNKISKKENKIIRTYVISKNLYEQFKTVAEKDMRKMSNVIEQSIVRYINSKTQKGDNMTGAEITLVIFATLWIIGVLEGQK